MSAGWIIIGIVWLVAPIVLGIALIVSKSNSRRRIDDLRRQLDDRAEVNTRASASPKDNQWLGNLGAQDIKSLLILDVELEQGRQSGAVSEEHYAELRSGWQAMWSEQLRLAGLEPDSPDWQTRRDEAWELYVERQEQPPGVPPWREKETDTSGPATPALEASCEQIEQSSPRDEPDDLVFDLEVVTASPPLPAPLPTASVAARISPDAVKRVEPASDRPQPAEGDRELPVPGPAPSVSHQPREESFSFTPAEPGIFDTVVETVSGWPRLAAPFLLQNVGWFVGAFCFIAGTAFLVSYTTGFANALAVLGSLAVYTALLLWAGYQMRKRRPDLCISSDVLLAIAMLLCPLNLTAATRLINLATGSTGLLVIATLAAAAVIAGTYLAAVLASGLMDRSLNRRHAQLFVALATVQLLVPWISQLSQWHWLAATHLLLLGLLGYGLFAFSNDWVRSIFVDRRQVAYYTAGLLVFAGIVSFTHLTWSFPGPLPRGYPAPFLMALGGMLFFCRCRAESLDQTTRLPVELYLCPIRHFDCRVVVVLADKSATALDPGLGRAYLRVCSVSLSDPAATVSIAGVFGVAFRQYRAGAVAAGMAFARQSAGA